MPSLPNDLWWEIIPHAISLENNLAMVKPSSERLYPFFPGSFSGFSDPYFYSSQLAIWKRNNRVAHSFVQVNRLWRGIAERFLYSALYVEEEWRVQRFIDTVKPNPNLSKQLRTLVIMPPIGNWGVKGVCFGPLVVQVLSLCHGIVAIVMESSIVSSPLPLFQSLDSSRPLELLSALRLRGEEFSTFMINFSNYASLQVLELSFTNSNSNSNTLPPFPQHITFPSLHTLILGGRPPNPLALDVIARWELPSLKELSIPRWFDSGILLLPLIQRSYDRLEFLSIGSDLLCDRDFKDIIRGPPFRLRNVVFKFGPFTCKSPPIRPATEPFFGHVVTLGIVNFQRIRHTDAWVRFFSDPKYMPHLRSVLTDVTNSLLDRCLDTGIPFVDAVRAFEEVLEDRGVAFKGVMDDHSSFFPIKLPERDILRSVCPVY